MLKEAEEYASMDTEARRRVEALNKLEEYVVTLRQQVADNSGLGGQVRSVLPAQELVHGNNLCYRSATRIGRPFSVL
jgi:hypothetical protein